MPHRTLSLVVRKSRFSVLPVSHSERRLDSRLTRHDRSSTQRCTQLAVVLGVATNLSVDRCPNLSTSWSGQASRSWKGCSRWSRGQLLDRLRRYGSQHGDCPILQAGLRGGRQYQQQYHVHQLGFRSDVSDVRQGHEHSSDPYTVSSVSSLLVWL